MSIEHVYVGSGPHDLHYTRCCVASIRRWYPDIPITLLKDEAKGPYSTRELEQAWDVGVFTSEHPLPGLGWAKLEPLFVPGGQRCLILDSDIVFVGRVIDRLDQIDADFIVESKGGWSPSESMASVYFDLDALKRLDPEYVFPGFTFNSGQLVATTGMLSRSDFEPFVSFGRKPKKLRPDVFALRDQGILNYILVNKAQRGELTLGREQFMKWGFNKQLCRGPQAIRTKKMTANSPYPYLVHWAGKKPSAFFAVPNSRLLRHFEADYYGRVPGGWRKRRLRSARRLWQFVTVRAKRQARRA